MKKFLITALLFLSVFVSGYTRRDGTYVQPHYRSSPNSSQYDNWSSKGNVNPYTGSQGYRTPEYNTSNPFYTPNRAYKPSLY